MSDVIAGQQAALDTAYRGFVGAGDRYALLDFPDHPNVGDSAIWLGEIALLRAVTGRDPDYVCTWHDFDEAAFRRACPDGVVLLHGGGNLGDIWPHHQRLREAVLARLTDRRIVQLPQSIHFGDPAAAARFARIAVAHPDFTLLVRDRPSLAAARGFVGGRALLAPDSAFAIGPQPRGTADQPLLALLRTDAERMGDRDIPHGVQPVDWLEDEEPLPDDRNARAAARLARGLKLLSRGERIVTDRLHAHILALLLGIPHHVLDNSYGKLAAYLDSWTGGSPLVRRVAA
ncbi:exopolysaccharide biosynthesis protein [Sphingomonas metalli]|uniref:Exopolysaccharide biosynthesis protein n=1 Tax=Sphingomonas metalli TaxID=1779358 RepID=A0A916WXU4_9SPHN|nr:polysaccharide pyruvyl transferase family protein [Sphingomonas metalli]GGB40865.1 exopolysaccharide biosynthesis protein [Sphingomonas metalli]